MANGNPTLKSVLARPDALTHYLCEKGGNHNHFKFYSRYEIIDSIIGNRCIYLTRGDNWNDLRDGIQFSSSVDGFVRFGACFSFSASESVAMWMLYGGINGRGAMVDFTKGDMASICRLESFELGYRTKDHGFQMVSVIDDGIKCYAIDILYCGESDESKYSIKRSDERVDGLPSPPRAPGILIKSYPWSYENEVRLVVEVSQEKVGGNVDCIRVPLPRSSGEMKKRAYLAPNNSEEGTGYNRSTLKGTLSWNLCRGCPKN